MGTPMKTWRLVSYGDSSEKLKAGFLKFSTGFHGTEVNGSPARRNLGIKNPILMDQTLEDYNLGLRVTGRLTYGPKPGAIDKD